jgi:hypothetical protein
MSWSRRNDTLYLDGLRVPNAGSQALSAATLSSRGTWGTAVPVDTPVNYHGTELTSDGRMFASIVSKRRFLLGRYIVEDRRATRRLPAALGLASDRHNDFSPDGKLSAFAREIDSRSDIYVVSASGGVPHRVTRLNAKTITAVRWSPDGASIAFIYGTDTSTGVGIVNPTTEGLRLIPSQLPIARDLGWLNRESSLGWSEDGSRLFFGATHMFQGHRSVGGVGTIELSSGRDSLIDSSTALSPIVSPSGKEIGYLSGFVPSIIHVDWRTGRRDSTPLSFRATLVRWERGDSLLMLRTDTSSTEVSRFSVATGRRTLVAVVPSLCLDVTLSIDGRTAVCEEIETGGEVWLATRDEKAFKDHFSFLRRRR